MCVCGVDTYSDADRAASSGGWRAVASAFRAGRRPSIGTEGKPPDFCRPDSVGR